MSEFQYIEVPIETDPEVLQQDAFDYLDAAISGWVPNDGNLETILIEALSRMTAEARDVASAVPTDIFRYFGELVGIPPQEATFAIASTDWTMINNAGYTIPAGTQVGIQLTGDEVVPFETVLDTVIPAGSTTALNVEIRAVEAGEGGSGLTGTMILIDTLDFVTTITLDVPGTTGGLDAEEDDDYINRLRLRLQLLAPRPILARDYAIFAQDIQGVERSTALDGYNPDHNLLTANQSNAETSTTGVENNSNTTVDRVNTNPAEGTWAWRLTSTTTGTVSARTTSGTGGIPVVPGDAVTVLASIRPGVTRSARVGVIWYDSGGTLMSNSLPATVSCPSGSYTQLNHFAIMPSGAAFAALVLEVQGVASAEAHQFDKLAMHRGASLVWSVGGTLATGNERMIAVAVVDAAGQPVGTTLKQEVDAYLQSVREVNFVVNVIDPVYTTIDVNFTAKALSGFDLGTVEVAAEQALTDYLSPANWGIPIEVADDTLSPKWVNTTVVRYLELTAVVNAVSGIDYIQTLTFRRGTDSFATTDITLAGPVALPLAGAVTGTVS